MRVPSLHDAVRSAYPTAGIIYGSDANALTAFDENHNPVAIEPAVITAKLAELQANYDAELQTAATIKQSALTKLAALGLTQAEITALIG